MKQINPRILCCFWCFCFFCSFSPLGCSQHSLGIWCNNSNISFAGRISRRRCDNHLRFLHFYLPHQGNQTNKAGNFFKQPRKTTAGRGPLIHLHLPSAPWTRRRPVLLHHLHLRPDSNNGFGKVWAKGLQRPCGKDNNSRSEPQITDLKPKFLKDWNWMTIPIYPFDTVTPPPKSRVVVLELSRSPEDRAEVYRG